MEFHRWYIQRSQAFGQTNYFFPKVMQKNGSYAGVFVSVDNDRPRAKPKARRYAVDASFMRSFHEIAEESVPAKVRALEGYSPPAGW